MSELFKTPYQISLWEDRVEEVIENGETVIKIKENMLAVIGSDTMETPIRAMEPKLVSNVNGTNTFTFSIYYRYYDEDKNEWIQNPLINYLVNERKVKLKLDNKWYDFIIKEVKEDTTKYTCTYTCKDLFINELSKNGYNIVLDTELRNNSGTIIELGKKVVEGTDWRIDEKNSDIFIQTKNEILYKYTIPALLQDSEKVSQSITATIMNGDRKGEEVVFSTGDTLYIFYSSRTNKVEDVQFLYPDLPIIVDKDNTILNSLNYQSADLHNMINDEDLTATSYFGDFLVSKQLFEYVSEIDTTFLKYTKIGDESGKVYYGYTETEYPTQAEIQNMLSNGNNYASVSGWSGSSSIEIDRNNDRATLPILSTYREIIPKEDNFSYDKINYIPSIKIQIPENSETGEWRLINSGLYDNRALLQKYDNKVWYFALKVNDKAFTTKDENGNLLREYSIDRVRVILKEVDDKSHTAPQTIVFERDEETKFYTSERVDGKIQQVSALEDYLIFKANFRTAMSYNTISKCNIDFSIEGTHLKDKRQKLIEMKAEGSDEQEIKKLQEYIKNTPLEILDSILFPEMFLRHEEQDIILVPNLKQEFDSLVKIKYNFFTLEDKSVTEKEYFDELKSLNDINILEVVYSDKLYDNYAPIYSKDYIKIGSVSVARSNRFNIIQELCETFECWADFQIDHETDGTIKEDGKRIVFKQYIGQDNYAGFRYGINLKSIQRNVKSDQIVSKLIVNQNVVNDKLCTIQEAKLNPTGESFILNFDYYGKHGLVNNEVLFSDLYSINGYFTILKKENDMIAPYREELIPLKTAIDQLTAKSTVLTALRQNIENKLIAIKEELGRIDSELINSDTDLPSSDSFYIDITTVKDDESPAICNYPSTLYYNRIAPNEYKLMDSSFFTPSESGYGYEFKTIYTYYILNEYVQKLCIQQEQYKKLLESYEKDEKLISDDLKIQEEKAKKLEAEIKVHMDEKEKVNKKFYQKYSRFIQEGTWTSSDFLDSELYYLAAQKVSYTSAFPQISYTISVIDVSGADGYESYKFSVGDKTYIEDTEYFGWDAQGRPYKEDVVVSETTRMLDDPSKNTFKIQNYKTQFEDLFQRVAAATQSLQYAEGRYERAANAINDDGSINTNLMQNSMNNNSLIIQNAKDNSVTWDDTGIRVSNYTIPNEIVRITSGGILLSSDGGKNWTTGITGQGINANIITAGQINTDNIRIYAGSNHTFEWDSDGISAFKQVIKDGEESIEYNSFVRFNQYGLFGYQSANSSETESEIDKKLSNLDDVIANSLFSLTWKGLNIRLDKGQQEEKYLIAIYDPSSTEVDEDGNPKPIFSIDREGNLIAKGEINEVAIQQGIINYTTKEIYTGKIYAGTNIDAPNASSTYYYRFEENGQILFAEGTNLIQNGNTIFGNGSTTTLKGDIVLGDNGTAAETEGAISLAGLIIIGNTELNNVLFKGNARFENFGVEGNLIANTLLNIGGNAIKINPRLELLLGCSEEFLDDDGTEYAQSTGLRFTSQKIEVLQNGEYTDLDEYIRQIANT